MRKNDADWAEANTLAQRVLEQQPEDPGGDRAGDEQPAELRIRVVRGDAPVAQAPAHAPRRSASSPRQKKRNRTIAVARWVATRKVMK